MKPTDTSNPEYFHKVVDCQYACPAHTPVPEYIRLIAQGLSVESKPLQFTDKQYHHLAVVYDNGKVTFYLDGESAGEAWLGGDAPVLMERNLFVGEDSQHSYEQQFRGNMDDILVLGRALTAAEVKDLSRKGAEAFFKKRLDQR